ncbi:MAG: transposase [Smithella sp.]
MPRIARIVVPGIPHHITQRGNRRQEAFFQDADYREYISFISEACRLHGVEIWAYCLMSNHVHLIAVPEKAESLRGAIGEAHRRYTRSINFRQNWRGHLWQERFASFPMNETYLLAAARYVELNPVRARMTNDPVSYPWSSAKSHLLGEDDELVRVKPLLDLVPDWTNFLYEGIDEKDMNRIRQHERTGRPLGDDQFIKKMEGVVNRVLMKRKPGPKKRNGGSPDN